jgi:membrane-anchored protein YejM (alkaline phosphatase superfamily)
MRLQAVALNRTIETLRAVNQLDNTIIVLTGDHGVRALFEDPGIHVGWASSYTFKVPLLIYAPKALKKMTPIAAPTSHVDLPSTVLALLGNQDALEVGEGMPVWIASPNRRLYFLAEGFSGFNAYEQDGVFCMQRLPANQNFLRAGNMEFGDADAVPPGDQRNHAIDNAFADYKALQRGFVETLIKNY